MARTDAGAALTARHRTAQLQLRSALLRDLTRLWPVWQLSDTDSFMRFVAAVSPLIRVRHRQSAALAATYFTRFRDVEGVDQTAGPRLAERLEQGRITRSLITTGLVGAIRAIQAGHSAEAARQNGLVRASGAATYLMLDGARQTIVRSVQGDRQATGWARVTAGSPCAFCAMLASRGPVFKTERTARFEAHDHCSCTAEPQYEGSEWPGRARDFQRLWREAQREAREAGEFQRGTSNDALNAFRRALSRQ